MIIFIYLTNYEVEYFLKYEKLTTKKPPQYEMELCILVFVKERLFFLNEFFTL